MPFYLFSCTKFYFITVGFFLDNFQQNFLDTGLCFIFNFRDIGSFGTWEFVLGYIPSNSARCLRGENLKFYSLHLANNQIIMAAAVSRMDGLVKEYLLFRGFHATLKTYESDIKNEKEKGFRVN